MSDVVEQIEALERRIAKLNKDRETLGKEQAVLEDRYEVTLKSLKAKGIDAEGMKRSELVSLRDKLSTELTTEFERLEAEVAKGEAVVAEFKKAQG